MTAPQSLSAHLVGGYVYGIYRTASELLGDKAWDFMWRAGELAYDEIEKSLHFPSNDPATVLQVVSKYMVDSGYMARQEVAVRDGDKVEIEMNETAFGWVARRLKAEGYVVHRWSTCLMNAALKKRCGMQMKRHAERAEFVNEKQAKTLWQLVPIGVSRK
ncbi:MAG: hypothetical protein HYX82_05780 [Chloroflexi bacterium]|nr:hypothetical protein [Chloroflexota bacterium]